MGTLQGKAESLTFNFRAMVVVNFCTRLNHYLQSFQELLFSSMSFHHRLIYVKIEVEASRIQQLLLNSQRRICRACKVHQTHSIICVIASFVFIHRQLAVQVSS